MLKYILKLYIFLFNFNLVLFFSQNVIWQTLVKIILEVIMEVEKYQKNQKVKKLKEL